MYYILFLTYSTLLLKNYTQKVPPRHHDKLHMKRHHIGQYIVVFTVRYHKCLTKSYPLIPPQHYPNEDFMEVERLESL